jgi:uncharacterized membrane protein
MSVDRSSLISGPWLDAFFGAMEAIVLVLEALGVAAILVGVIFSTIRFLRHRRPLASHEAYVEYRHGIGRSTLLGLDFLIAGDIIKTVIVVQTGPSVLVLGLVVLIRAFLSIALHVETEGRWPWQPDPRAPLSGDGREARAREP